ncbi:hypothetical protein HDV01_004224 [Terramyces sp. JEL0728]|nr:hypothetical protein HDV01_004224 [Terramyces sp. JEL0728]
MLESTDTKVLVSGCDIDGIPRGKVLNIDKFKHCESGFCNVIFGWDMHDQNYDPKTPIQQSNQGYSDILAKIDMSTFRRCPITNTPHFLVDFYNPLTNKPLPYCPRSLLKSTIQKQPAMKAFCGVEFEFFNFKETSDSLAAKKGMGLQPLTSGMFGYSLARPTVHQQFFDDIYEKSREFNIPLECFHTETGPGVYEAAIAYTDVLELSDRAHLFKMLAKKIGTLHGVTPCFMAKPYGNQPGCSGHLHFSLQDNSGNNLFSDPNDPQKISNTCRHFIAGVLQGLESIMAILAPTINSYKRLNIAYWAPVTVSYGFEDRISAIRIITPPICSSSATRIEIRVPGADVNCYLATAALLACGYYGIENKLELPPLKNAKECKLLPQTLALAVEKMGDKDSFARKVLSNDFIDHYVATRRHEIRLWQLAVTDWELSRYMETV